MGWIAGLIGAAGALGGGALGAEGASDASKAQQKALREQLAFQRWMYEQNSRRSEPWRATGQGALNQLAQLYGIPYMPYQAPQYGQSGPGGYGGGTSQVVGRSGLGDPLGLPDPLGIFGNSGRTATWGGDNLLTAKNVAKMLKQGRTIEEISKLGYLESSLNPRRLNKLTKKGLSVEDIQKLQAGPAGLQAAQQPANGGLVTPTGPDMSVFQASPDYQFRRDQGMEGIQNSFAARGGAFSGNALKALNEYNSGLASQEFGNFVNRRENLAGLGQSANNTQAGIGMQFSSQGGNALANMGDARASGIANSANMWGNALSGAANAFGQYWGNRPSQPFGQQYQDYMAYGQQGWGG